VSVKCYQLYCDYCGYKRISDGSDCQDLYEIKQSPVPGGVPQLDPMAKKERQPGGMHQPAVETSKLFVPKPSLQRKKFRCPKCGRVIMARQIQKTEYETNQPDGSEASSTGLSFP
jgi:predicted RNA-binding Zn-ribbon protein involved in translation (DUF1610 family)